MLCVPQAVTVGYRQLSFRTSLTFVVYTTPQTHGVFCLVVDTRTQVYGLSFLLTFDLSIFGKS